MIIVCWTTPVASSVTASLRTPTQPKSTHARLRFPYDSDARIIVKQLLYSPGQELVSSGVDRVVDHGLGQRRLGVERGVDLVHRQTLPQRMPYAVTSSRELSPTGAWPYNRPCAQQYVGKSQSCMVISGRLIVHAAVLTILNRHTRMLVTCVTSYEAACTVCFHIIRNLETMHG